MSCEYKTTFRVIEQHQLDNTTNTFAVTSREKKNKYRLKIILLIQKSCVELSCINVSEYQYKSIVYVMYKSNGLFCFYFGIFSFDNVCVYIYILYATFYVFVCSFVYLLEYLCRNVSVCMLSQQITCVVSLLHIKATNQYAI